MTARERSASILPHKNDKELFVSAEHWFSFKLLVRKRKK